MSQIAKVQLLAIKSGYYTIYVFKNLDNNSYIMCTRLPNWQVPEFSIEDKGFLEYVYVKAGESYFNPKTGETQQYQYSNVYFLNFIQDTNFIQDKTLVL
jgi:hypothetical protein